MTAMQLLRLAKQLFLEGLRCVWEADAVRMTSVRRRNLGGRRRSVRPVWHVRATPANLAFSTRMSAPYAASWRSCHQAWTASAVADPAPSSSSWAARRTSRSGGRQESFWEGTRPSRAVHTAWTVPSGVRRAWADHHRASEAAAAAGACCSGLSWDQRKRRQDGSAAAKTRSANTRSHCTIRWVLRPGSKTLSAPTHRASGPTRTQSSSRFEGRPTSQTTFVGSPNRRWPGTQPAGLSGPGPWGATLPRGGLGPC